jgi:hypothetical protein
MFSLRSLSEQVGNITHEYLLECKEIESAWDDGWVFPRFVINWTAVKERLEINPPQPLVPLTKINNNRKGDKN